MDPVARDMHDRLLPVGVRAGAPSVQVALVMDADGFGIVVGAVLAVRASVTPDILVYLLVFGVAIVAMPPTAVVGL